jgi:phosphoribosylformylglycinamidine cyclo-ligase
MARTFNCGIGMVAITAPESAEAAARILSGSGETVYRIGVVDDMTAQGGPRVVVDGAEHAWRG